MPVPGATILLFFLGQPGAPSPATGTAGASQILNPWGWQWFLAGPSSPTAPGTLRRALVAALKGSTTVTATVGTGVFPIFAPEDHPSASPALLYRIDADDRDHDLGGPTGVARATARFAVGSPSFSDCEDAAAAVRRLFDGFAGTLSGVTVLEMSAAVESDEWESVSDGSETGKFWTTLEYRILYREG